jgi:RNA polymerase sigma-70 factor (ECF subfamily)
MDQNGSNSSNWDSLAKQAQDGDQKAYRQLLTEITPYIKGSIAGGLANPDWVDDITQNILISVHKSLATYSPSRPFKPWLYSIISFRKADYLRKYYNKRRNQHVPVEDATFSPELVTNPATSGEYKDIEKALEVLPDKQRKIIELMKIEGYTAKEVGEKLDMKESAVKVSAHRSMQKMKDILGQ